MERLRHFALITSAVAALSATACSTADDFAAEVALEAEWQCDVQRQSFGDLSDLGCRARCPAQRGEGDSRGVRRIQKTLPSRRPRYAPEFPTHTTSTAPHSLLTKCPSNERCKALDPARPSRSSAGRRCAPGSRRRSTRTSAQAAQDSGGFGRRHGLGRPLLGRPRPGHHRLPDLRGCEDHRSVGWVPGKHRPVQQPV